MKETLSAMTLLVHDLGNQSGVFDSNSVFGLIQRQGFGPSTVAGNLHIRTKLAKAIFRKALV